MTKVYIAFIFIALFASSPKSYSQTAYSKPIKISICPFTSFDQHYGEDKFEYYIGISFLGLDEFEIDYNSSACPSKNSKGNTKEIIGKSAADYVLGGQYSSRDGELYISGYLYQIESGSELSLTPEFGEIKDAYSVFSNFGNKVKNKIYETQDKLAESQDQLAIICTSNKDAGFAVINGAFKDITQKVTDNVAAPSGLSIIPGSKSSVYYFKSKNLQDVADKVESNAVLLLDMHLQENYDIVVKPSLYLKNINTTIPLIDINSSYYAEKDFEETMLSEINYFLNEMYSDSNRWNYKALQIKYDNYQDYHKAAGQYRNSKEYYLSNYFYYQALNFGSVVPEKDRAFIHNEIGYNRFLLKQYDEAISELNKSLDIDHINIYALYLKGLSYNDLGEPQNAVTYLTKTDNIERNYRSTSLYLGYNYYLLEDYDSAIFFLKSVLNNPNRTDTDRMDATRYLGYSFHNNYEYDSAIYYYKEMLQIQPDFKKNLFINLSTAYVGKGTNLYFDSLYVDAIRAFNYAKEYDEENTTIIPDYLRRCNNQLLKLPEARRIIKDGLQKGVFERESIYFTQAEDLTIIFYRPNNSQATLTLIADEIFYNLKEDIKLNPEHAEAYFRYGNINTVLGNLREGLNYLEQAIEYNPEYITGRLDLTEAYILNELPSTAIGLNRNFKYDDNKRNNALIAYLTIVAKIMVDEDYSAEISILDQLLEVEKVVITNWVFSPFNSWLANTNLTAEKKNAIKKLTERMEGG